MIETAVMNFGLTPKVRLGRFSQFRNHATEREEEPETISIRPSLNFTVR